MSSAVLNLASWLINSTRACTILRRTFSNELSLVVMQSSRFYSSISRDGAGPHPLPHNAAPEPDGGASPIPTERLLFFFYQPAIQPFKFILAIKMQDQRSLALRIVLEIHLDHQRLAKMALQAFLVRRAVGCWSDLAYRGLNILRSLDAASQFFGLTNVQVQRDDLTHRRHLVLFIRNANQGAGVSLAKVLGLVDQGVAHFRRELEQA